MAIALILLLTNLVVGCAPSLDDYLNSGYARIDECEYDEAINDFNQALELAPDDAEALVGRAIANAWAGYYTQADNDFNMAIEMSFGRFTLMTADAYVAWGIAIAAQYSSYSKLDEAEYLFDSAISRDSNNSDAYTGRALMHLKEAYGDVIEAESIGFHRLSDAISDFEKAIELDPEGIQGRIKRFSFEGDMAFLPNYIEANKRRGAVLVSTDIYCSNGLEEYDRVLKVCPDDVEALVGRGSAYMGLQQYDLGLHDFDRAIGLTSDKPDKALIHARRGDCFFQNQKYDEAAADYAKALELDPLIRPSTVYIKLIDELDEQIERDLYDQQYDRAIMYITKALAFKPTEYYYHKLAEAYDGRGMYRYEHGGHDETDEAIADFTRAIELDPDNAEYYFSRALIYSTLADYYWDKVDYHWNQYENQLFEEALTGLVDSNNKAIADFTKVIEFTPEHAGAYFERGQCYAAIGDYVRAITDFTKAIELGKEDWPAYFNRASAYKELGDKNKALADYRKALALAEDDFIKEQSLKYIEELQSD